MPISDWAVSNDTCKVSVSKKEINCYLINFN